MILNTGSSYMGHFELGFLLPAAEKPPHCYTSWAGVTLYLVLALYSQVFVTARTHNLILEFDA